MTIEFFDRAKEKYFLDGLRHKSEKQMIVVYGRRRIGKTMLLKHVYPYAKYLFVDTISKETLLKDFSEHIFDGVFGSWEAFFKHLLNNNDIVIIDEFQNFLRVDNSVFSILQKVWDGLDSKVLLILCGSYTGMMKHIFLDYKEPLFGRSAYQINLKEFDFIETAKMLNFFGYDTDEIIDRYSVFGGIPKYLWYLKTKEEFKIQIKNLFFDELAPLREEGKNLLIGEFGSEHRGYFSILEKIGCFDKEIGEIVDKTGMERTKVMKYISELADYYGIIEKVENKLCVSKRGIRYRIKDNFLNFWFKYIYSNQDKIEFNPENAFNFAVKNINEFIGRIFEEIIKSIIPNFYKAGLIPFLPETIGKHWGKIPHSKDVYEIDIVGESKDALLIAECKWRNKKTSIKDMDNFLNKCTYINDKRKIIKVFISKSGFENNVFSDKNTFDIIKIDIKGVERVIFLK